MTIFALSSGAGRAGIAVVRISGPAAGNCLETIIGRDRPAPRKLVQRTLQDPIGQRALDRALVVWLPGPASFTGEDCAELHLHGGSAVVAAVLDCLSRLPGLRLAEPGEFTRRAFDQGKLDLAEVEGLADLINAETEAQRRQALKQYNGDLSRLIEAWRDRLVPVLAHCEALIDFSDEELPESVAASLQSEMLGLESEIRQYLVGQGPGERLRDGLEVALAGAPNVGKSSLLNQFAARDVAIVSEVAGTTRDTIEVRLDLGGYPVTMVDTAGLRDLVGPGGTETIGQVGIEAEGVRRARERAAASDLKVVIFDASVAYPFEGESLALVDDRALVVINKIDIGGWGSGRDEFTGRTCYRVSAKTGEGIAALIEGLTAEVAERFDGSGPVPAVTRIRHRVALEDCRAALARGSALEPGELLAEDLRLAVRALGRITGRVDVEDLLDVVFKDFCIGK